MHQDTSKVKSMEIIINGVDVMESPIHEYLGVTMDRNFALADHFRLLMLLDVRSDNRLK